MNKPTQNYITLATEAVEQEQAKKFNSASQLWQQAAVLARKEINQKWAASRAAFCHKNSYAPFETLQDGVSK